MEETPAAFPERPVRVLVVDDDPNVRQVLSDLVESLGFIVRTASDGPGALERVRGDVPDAVLLDIQMPGMDGLEVCRRLRGDPRSASVPILLVTAHSDLETRLIGFQAGADDYVSKPFELRELAARLRAHLELACMRRQLDRLQGVLATIRLIAHEFGNPLQAVVGAHDMLRAARESGADDAEALSMLSQATDDVREIARRLIMISEPSFKQTPLGPMLDIDASR